MNEFLSNINWYSVIVTVVLVILGYITSYIKTKGKLIEKAEDFINVAEENYKNATTAGAEKFAFVVDTLYNFVPAVLKPFITRQLISSIVQSVFDSMKNFADQQLDKVVDKIVNKGEVPVADEDCLGAEDA